MVTHLPILCRPRSGIKNKASAGTLQDDNKEHGEGRSVFASPCSIVIQLHWRCCNLTADDVLCIRVTYHYKHDWTFSLHLLG